MALVRDNLSIADFRDFMVAELAQNVIKFSLK